MLSPSTIMDSVKEITIAQITNSAPILPDADSAKSVADYMQVIYDKIVEPDSMHHETKQLNR